ncbi:type-F conjugative transfer system secretin TraK [uncultured Croceicoccus sp.]|uniref:type-F conjugative transfer system secretin TraK n=1 Tax=uncultured Croceicoccus sp. TaxID=1295329 RepID=UPI00260213B3|nr:type-F conjugative transfer system secretin TraK [uncultured Croceicoccus sp.]
MPWPNPIPRLPLAGLAIAAALAGTTPALADQFKQAADGAAIDCTVSQRELTRFALVEDQFASVSKISSGYPYSDFAVSNEPLRGDIYVSIPETFAARSISFFATTKKGQVYKFACRIEAIGAQQVFITNPALGQNAAARFEEATAPEETAVRLIRAMASAELVEGYEIRSLGGLPARVGDFEIQLVSDYRGAAFTGKVLRIANRTNAPVTLDADALAPVGTLALAFGKDELAPGEATSAYLVTGAGVFSHD